MAGNCSDYLPFSILFILAMLRVKYIVYICKYAHKFIEETRRR